MKCLEKDRARRYATANGIAADIQRHLEHEPITARPPSGMYRLRKLARRNRGALITPAVVLADVKPVALVHFKVGDDAAGKLVPGAILKSSRPWR